ncbi:MAG TPA: trypsin-like serine protease [Polyangia bacterium]|jgi:hypothetical protein|nr:trypsin-like serine protease [Polyangia bacterium]
MRSSFRWSSSVLLCAVAVVGCGSPDEPEEEFGPATSAIQGGQIETGYPAVGRMTSSAGGCTAELIGPSLVLSAKHCAGSSPRFYTGTQPADFVRQPIDTQLVHPTRDLWLVHLASPLAITPLVTNTGALPAVGTVCTAVGFGAHDDPGGIPTGKRSATETVTSATTSIIKVLMGTGIADSGDSGGPLICNGAVAGVVWRHTDGNWPTHQREIYTTVDPTWLAANSGLKRPPTYNSLYIAQDGGGIYRVDRRWGNWETVQEDPTATTSMVIINRDAWVIKNQQLHKISLADGTDTAIGGQVWFGPTVMALAPGLFVLESGGLWKVDDLSTGAFHRVGTKDWTGATSMAALNGKLYIIHSSKLYRVEPSTGAAVALGGSDWGGPTRMVGMASKLYVFQDNKLWVVNNLSTGGFALLNGEDWSGLSSMAAMDSSLYAIQANYLSKISPVDGSYTALGGADWGGGTNMASTSCSAACNEICQETCAGPPGPGQIICLEDCEPSCEARECQ